MDKGARGIMLGKAGFEEGWLGMGYGSYLDDSSRCS